MCDEHGKSKKVEMSRKAVLSLLSLSRPTHIILSTVEGKERCIRRKAVLQAFSIAEKWRWDPVVVVRGSVCCRGVSIVVVGLVSVDGLSFSLLTLMLRVKVLDGSWRRCDYTIVSQKRQKKTKDVNC